MRVVQRVGSRVRQRREARGLTQRALAEASGLSPRFLAQLEAGQANISIDRLDAVARALGVTMASLVEEDEVRGGVIALIGLRGAGKSTVGAALAKRLKVPFRELDREVEAVAGLGVGEIFELHGDAYYRRLERETLSAMLSEGGGMGPSGEAGGAKRSVVMVIATGGSIVNDRETFRLLRRRAMTVWLRARPEDHMNRVIQQGDHRPMAERPDAMAELRALLSAREKRYAEAELVVDTSRLDVRDTVEAIERHFHSSSSTA